MIVPRRPRSSIKRRGMCVCVIVWSLFLTSSLCPASGDVEPTNGASPTQSLLESLWNTVKQKLENASFLAPTDESSDDHLSTLDELSYAEGVVASTKQSAALSHRRISLYEETIENHYTQLLKKTVSALGGQLPTYFRPSFFKTGLSVVVDHHTAATVIRWNVTTLSDTNNYTCFYFKDSLHAYWAFGWCPQTGVWQGTVDTKSTKLMNVRHQIGGPLVTIADLSESIDASILALAKSVLTQYPEVNKLELHPYGDDCHDEDDSRNKKKKQTKRLSIVAFHDLKRSKHCHGIQNNNRDDASATMIARVDEPTTCQYLIHVCQASLSIHDDDISQREWEKMRQDHLLSNNTLPDDDSIVTSKMKSIMHDIQMVVNAYGHESSVNTFNKNYPDKAASMHLGFPPMPNSRIQANIRLVKDMFMHAYDSYMFNAYPYSDLKPVTCEASMFNLVQIPALTVIDSLDTLILLGNYTEFARAVERLRRLNDQLSARSGQGLVFGGMFELDRNVSLFETNIRVLGGLLSAHQLADSFLNGKVVKEDVFDAGESVAPKIGVPAVYETCSSRLRSSIDCSTKTCDAYHDELGTSCNNDTLSFWKYDGILLELAEDIGDRLMPAFATSTGIPYGTVNLQTGIPKGETTIASLAGAGSLSLEMELLSRLTGDPDYGRAAKLATRALFMRGSNLNIYGKHICSQRGDWTETLSGIGSNSDSFYEYLVKHYVLFPEDPDFWDMAFLAYGGIHNETRAGEWYGDTDMLTGTSTGKNVRFVFEALMAFYPGMQVLLGELAPAARSLNSFFLIREHLGFLPERFDYGNWRVAGGQHLLRPELLESAYFMHRASKGFQQSSREGQGKTIPGLSGWQWAADSALHTLESWSNTGCGYASITKLSPSTTGATYSDDVERERHWEDEMPSYFLSETLKYLYLIFDESNILHSDEDHDWIFTTEAHPIYHVSTEKGNVEKGVLDLKELLQSRLMKKSDSRSEIHELRSEKWAEKSPVYKYEAHLKVRTSGRSTQQQYPGNDSTELPNLFEFSLDTGQAYRDLDRFGETSRQSNTAHLTLNHYGQYSLLSRSCPNLYSTELLWVHAINGGLSDYSSAYVSKGHDFVAEGENRFQLVGSMDALALYGSGAHPAMTMKTYMNLCPVKEPPKQTSFANGSIARKQSASKNLFDMGGDLGKFEVSAFPQGSGFYIRHVNSEETVVTTLITDNFYNTGKGSTFVMVYSHKPETVASFGAFEIKINQATNKVLSSLPNAKLSPGKADRSVIMSDLDGNSFVCRVDLVQSTGNDDDNDQAENSLASFPCAPAMFGPTHLHLMSNDDGMVIDATPAFPREDTEQYGCIKDQDQSDEGQLDQTQWLHPDEQTDPDEQSEVCHDNLVVANDADSCPANIVLLVQRGQCTFQEKALNGKSYYDADAVIVINSEADEVFVMSGGGIENEEPPNADDIPPTVLVSGSDGKAIVETMKKQFAVLGESTLRLRVSLVRDSATIVDTDTTTKISVTDNKFWPTVHATPEALHVFTKSGWGIQASRKVLKNGGVTDEWQMSIVRHEAPVAEREVSADEIPAEIMDETTESSTFEGDLNEECSVDDIEE